MSSYPLGAGVPVKTTLELAFFEIFNIVFAHIPFTFLNLFDGLVVVVFKSCQNKNEVNFIKQQGFRAG